MLMHYLAFLQEDGSSGGSGTFVVRTPKGRQSSSFRNDQSSPVMIIISYALLLFRNFLLFILYLSVMLFTCVSLSRLAAHMLLLMMLLLVALWLYVASMKNQNLLARLSRDLECQKEVLAPLLKTVLLTWLRLALYVIKCSQYFFLVPIVILLSGSVTFCSMSEQLCFC